MTLKEKLQEDFIKHYKAQEKDAVAVLRAVNGAIATEEKSGKTASEFSDNQVETLIAREAKKRRASADEYASVGAEDRAEKEAWEADFLMGYLPEQLGEDEVRLIVRSVINKEDTGGNMGLVMKSVMPQVKGKADGKMVKQIVSEELAG